jgi:integrase
VRSAVKAAGDGKGERSGAVYALRFTAYGERRYVTLGRTDEGWTEHKAEEELRKILGEVRDNKWKPWEPAEEPEQPEEEPTFHVFASEWFEATKDEWREATRLDYQWQLQFHLLPYFKDHRLSDITIAEVDRYRQSKLAANRAIESAAAKGKPRMATHTHPSGKKYKRPERPLSATSINKTITRLGQILEVAVERELIARNPARIGGKRRKVKATRPHRAYLDRPEQAEALLEAAGQLDREAKANGRIARRALVTTLTIAGLRISEALDLEWRDINLAAGRLRVRNSKTAAGTRYVDLLPRLHDELTALKANARTPEPGQYVFPSAVGTRQDRNRARNRVLAPAIKRANEQLANDGRTALPEGLTLHALRRTHISVLIALGYDLRQIMEQAGHTDPTVTVGMYAQPMRPEDRAAWRTFVGVDEDAILGQEQAAVDRPR